MLGLILGVIISGITVYGVNLILKSEVQEDKKLKSIMIIVILFSLILVVHELKSAEILKFSLLNKDSK